MTRFAPPVHGDGMTPKPIALLAACAIGFASSALAADAPAPETNEWFTLEGKPAAAGNAADDKGIVQTFLVPVMRVTRSSRPDNQGTVLLFPGGAYRILDTRNEGALTAAALNDFGYDVVMLEYHINAGPTTRDLALADAQAAWQLLQGRPETLGIHHQRFVVMGYSAGGHLAARLTQSLAARATPGPQPDDLVLVYPAYLQEPAPGGTAPLVQPPAHPQTRLIALMAANDRAYWLKGAQDYAAAWQKTGAYGVFRLFKDGGHGFGMKPNRTGDIEQWPDELAYFLEYGPKPGVGPFNTYLPWFLANNQGRLAAFKRTKANDQDAVVFLGDSITAKWNLAQAFPDLKTANRGISGDTTRGMLVRLQDNVLDLQPKAVVFMGGINDLTQSPTGTPEIIAANVRSILERIRKDTPSTPVLVCETLPSHSASLETLTAVNQAVDKVVAEFPNAHRVKTYGAFLKSDGTLNADLFLDGTHPTPAGYAVWHEILAPELAKYAKR